MRAKSESTLHVCTCIGKHYAYSQLSDVEFLIFFAAYVHRNFDLIPQKTDLILRVKFLINFQTILYSNYNES